MKKKFLALVMAAAIMTGMGTYGTYAYFTDSENLNEKVNITMGTVDVVAYWANEGKSKWTPTSQATEVVAIDNGDTLSFNNVKPGDTFERDIVVENKGSLNSDINVAINTELLGNMQVELVNVYSQSGNVILDPNIPDRYYENGMQPGAFIKATVKVTVPTTMTNDWMDKSFNADAHRFIKASAHQTIR